MKNVTKQNYIANKRIKALREDKGMTQEELAEKLYISREALANFETRREIPEDKLQEFANYFETTTDYLLGNTNVKCSNNKEYQLIGKYTGLNDKAIQILGELKKFAPDIINTLNYLIEQEEWFPTSNFSRNENISEEEAYENFKKMNDYWEKIHFPILSKINDYYNVEMPNETLYVTNNGIKHKKDFKTKYEMIVETKAKISSEVLSNNGLLGEIENQLINSKKNKSNKSQQKVQNQQMKKYIENYNKF